jgi:hypothetical protein
MAEVLTQDIIKHSVTEDDVMEYQGKGIINFVMPYFWATPRVFSLPTDLPPYWSFQRDVTLRSTILFESFWASAVAIAATKVAAQSFDVSGDVPARVKAAQRMMVQWGGNGYVPSQESGILDFTCTDNGEFHEVVRQSSAAGSKILGLVHLDSLRCQRTGDPNIPILFRDLKGGLHEMRDYQVINLVDMPDPGYSWLGVGHCGAERAFNQIYKQAGIDRTLAEKVTGSGAHQISLVNGMNSKQLGDLIATAESEARAKGFQYYLGTILAGIMGDTPAKFETLQLRGLPENFDRKEELDITQLAYANALGLVLTDLQPLSGQGLGTGKQSETIEDKGRGRGLVARNKQLTQLLNEWVMPDSVTFYFHERDFRDELQQAEVANQREAMRNSMILNGQLQPAQGLQMAVDADDVPHEFLPVDATADDSLGDEERSDQIEEENAEQTAQPLPAEMSPRDQKIVDRQRPEPIGALPVPPSDVPGKAKKKEFTMTPKEAHDQIEEMRAFFAYARPLARNGRFDDVEKFQFKHCNKDTQRQLFDGVFVDAIKEKTERKEVDYTAIRDQLLSIKEALNA